MSNKQNKNAMVRKPRQNSQRPRTRDNVLYLRPEYKGQPVVAHKIVTFVGPQSTTVTTGVIAVNTTLSSALINAFATRFAGYSEFRIVKAEAIIRCYSSTNPGIIRHWFSEDDSAAPSINKALNVTTKDFSASAIIPEHRLTYTPHDPAQQTWTLVASGAPVIGYHKVYTDNANFGASIAVTPYFSVVYELTVQLRGFI